MLLLLEQTIYVIFVRGAAYGDWRQELIRETMDLALSLIQSTLAERLCRSDGERD